MMSKLKNVQLTKYRHFIQAAQLAALRGFFDIPTRPVTEEPGKIPSDIATRFLGTFTLIAYPLAFIAIIYSAYMLLTSLGNADAYSKAKKNLIYILTGIILLLGSTYIFNFFRSIFGPLNPAP